MKDNLYLYDRLEEIREKALKNKKPYDVGDHLLAVNSRYGYLEDSIKNNYFKTEYIGWLDFSAGHIVDIPSNFKFKNIPDNKVKISWISRYRKKNFVFNHLALGGGFFIGSNKIMKELIRIHDIEFKRLLDYGFIINDDKLLFLIFEKYPYLFRVYHSGYKYLFTKSSV